MPLSPFPVRQTTAGGTVFIRVTSGRPGLSPSNGRSPAAWRMHRILMNLENRGWTGRGLESVCSKRPIVPGPALAPLPLVAPTSTSILLDATIIYVLLLVRKNINDISSRLEKFHLRAEWRKATGKTRQVPFCFAQNWKDPVLLRQNGFSFF